MHTSSPLAPRSSRRPWPRWPSLTAAAVLLLAFALPLPRHGAIAGLPSICGFHIATGLPCPGCGLTRSIVSCAHGQWSEAFTYHPLGPIFFAGFGAIAALGLIHVVAPRQVQELVGTITGNRQVVRWLAIVAATTLIAIWLSRLAGWLPSPP